MKLRIDRLAGLASLLYLVGDAINELVKNGFLGLTKIFYVCFSLIDELLLVPETEFNTLGPDHNLFSCSLFVT